MARVVEYEDDGSGGWQPLPDGGYDFQIKACEMMPKKENQKGPQLKIEMEVVTSPDGNNIGKKSVIWVPMVVGWRVSEVLQAAGIAFEELGEGKYRFDLDDLIGCYMYADVTIDASYTPPGKNKPNIKNEFKLQPSSLSDGAGAPEPVPAPAPAPAPADPFTAPASQPIRRGGPAAAAPTNGGTQGTPAPVRRRGMAQQTR